MLLFGGNETAAEFAAVLRRPKFPIDGVRGRAVFGTLPPGEFSYSTALLHINHGEKWDVCADIHT